MFQNYDALSFVFFACAAASNGKSHILHKHLDTSIATEDKDIQKTHERAAKRVKKSMRGPMDRYFGGAGPFSHASQRKLDTAIMHVHLYHKSNLPAGWAKDPVMMKGMFEALAGLIIPVSYLIIRTQ